jgi:glycosyltransferase involved in cell wall biosynthesis
VRIFQLNKYATLNGGSETVADIVGRIGNRAGHQVFLVGYEKPGQLPLFESDSLGPDAMSVKGMFRNATLVERVVQWAKEFKPDAILHHNIYHHFPMAQLVDALDREVGVPQSIILHDHKPVCPVYVGYREGHACHECKGGGLRYLNALRHRCKDGSFVKTSLLTMDSIWNSGVFGVYSRFHRVISPSRFLASNVQGIGKGRKIEVLTNPCPPVRVGNERREGVAYASRLTSEKGLPVLLRLADSFPDQKFLVAGDGPLQAALDEAVAKHPNIHPLGRLTREATVEMLGSVKFLLIPSLGMENNPMIILEAFARGTPVIGTDRGGIPELLEGDKGFLFDPGSAESTFSVFKKAMDLDDAAWSVMSRRCSDWATENSEEHYIQKLAELLS